jgi:ketosteroid isomerase-like protein
MSSDESLNVLQRHGAAAEAGDLDAVMADYTDESVLISSRHGVLTGAAIRGFFESPADMTGFAVTGLHIEGDVILVTWKTAAVPAGSDTFVIRDGKIAVQTVAFGD